MMARRSAFDELVASLELIVVTRASVAFAPFKAFTIAVRVSAATYTDLKKRAGQRMAETGESCSVSEIVRFAIENELTKS